MLQLPLTTKLSIICNNLFSYLLSEKPKSKNNQVQYGKFSPIKIIHESFLLTSNLLEVFFFKICSISENTTATLKRKKINLKYN